MFENFFANIGTENLTLIQQLLIVCPLIFLAGFIDSIAGGGGLISLPAYYMAGLPPHYALGSNKMSSSVGIVFSTSMYVRGDHVYKKIILVSVVGALFGSWIGARCALMLDEEVLLWIMVILVPIITLFIVLKRDLFTAKERNIPVIKEQIIVAAISLIIGWYDGFFGPGAGMFLVFSFIGFLHLNPVTANGNAKIVNLCSNVAALVTFATGGKVLFALALPCAVFSIAGNMLGARLAIKKGAKIIKPIMLVVILLLLLTIVRNLVGDI